MAKIPSNNIFTRIATSKWGKKFYERSLNPKNDTFWNETVPLIETSVATTAYIINTQVQKNIDDKSKKALQIQNVLSWVVSLGISIPLSKKFTKISKGIEKHLNPDVIPDFHKVKSGLGIIVPLTFVTVLNRALIPSVLVPISSVIRDKYNKRRQLDIKA